jgi:divalent metal cation (Fe/Co/Zn/Cd) transporter
MKTESMENRFTGLWLEISIRASWAWKHHRHHLFDGLAALLIGIVVIALSIAVGIYAVKGDNVKLFITAQKFQMVTLLAYIAITGIVMGLVLLNRNVRAGKQIVYLVAPVILYGLLGVSAYYALMPILAVATFWRALDLRRHTRQFSQRGEDWYDY